MRRKLSKISALHYFKLFLRSAIFVVSLVFYILDKFDILAKNWILPMIVWLFFIIGMLLRFFPSRFESMGCQKQFARNYEPISKENTPTNQSWKRTALVAAVWLTLNAVIGALYFAGIFDRELLILIALAYSACDIICILFFCPFYQLDSIWLIFISDTYLIVCFQYNIVKIETLPLAFT